MENEKVKEIKKALECCSTLMDNNATSEEQDNACNECPCRKNDRCSWNLDKDALMLINELEHEKYNLYNLNQNLISDKQVLMHENERLGKNNELLRNAKVVYETVDYCYEDLKKAEKRIAELEKENETKTDTITDLLKKQEFYEKQKLKQFAERLKEKIKAIADYYNDEVFDYSYNGISEKDIDETLKEFLK